MTVEANEVVISQRSEPERQELTDWFDELREEAWGRQIESDFGHGGRATAFMEKIGRQIAAGQDTCPREGWSFVARNGRASEIPVPSPSGILGPLR
ncbi:MAG: hypothetical protein U0Q16_32970 [Bryobacteraceae bacterium]